jgi:hypothetical protein
MVKFYQQLTEIPSWPIFAHSQFNWFYYGNVLKMRHCVPIIFFFGLFIVMVPLMVPQAQAYRLVTIDYVSTSEKTFVIRLGLKQQVAPGQEATFSTPYTAVVAKAIRVTQDYSHWKIQEPLGHVPFQSGEWITYQGSTEGIWSLDPDRYFYLMADDEQREKLPIFLTAEEEKKRKLAMGKPFAWAFSLRGFWQAGLHQAISLANSESTTERLGTTWEILGEHEITTNLYVGLGYRQDSEISDSLTVMVQSLRRIFLIDLSYHLNPEKRHEALIPYVGAQLGIGASSTTVATVTQTGLAKILPGVRLGVDFLFLKSWAMGAEMGVENLVTTEKFPDGGGQTSMFSNLRFGLGLKSFF